MAVINVNTYPTLSDVAKRLEPGGKVDKITEMLSETNEILTDMVMIEGNLPTGHKSTIRTGLPEATWRRLNYGVQPSKSKTAQVTDTCGMLEAYAEVDKSLADLNGNTAAFRLSEDRAFLEAMNQEMASTLFYGDATRNPERFHGLSARYDTLGKSEYDIAKYVIDAGGVAGADASLQSIWLLVWGPNTIHGIYPKGSKGGWQHKDLGEATLEDTEGGRFQGYRTHYKWDIGLTVRDHRFGIRIANIDPKTITGSKLVELMVEASERLENKNMGRAAWYMSRPMRTKLRFALRSEGNVRAIFDNTEGHTVLSFDGIPVRQTDALDTKEAQVK